MPEEESNEITSTSPTNNTVYQIMDNEYTEDKFYILARNMNYIYCISDRKTFEKAGFTGLANNGIQIINHDR